MQDTLRRPDPKITPLTAPFWEHANNRVLATPKCSDCGARHFPPGPFCPECLSENITWSEVSGRATLTSWVVFHQVYWDEVKEEVPYLVATVDLEEGVRLLTSLVGAAEKAPVYGMKLKVTFRPNASGQLLPVFEAA